MNEEWYSSVLSAQRPPRRPYLNNGLTFDQSLISVIGTGEQRSETIVVNRVALSVWVWVWGTHGMFTLKANTFWPTSALAMLCQCSHIDCKSIPNPKLNSNSIVKWVPEQCIVCHSMVYYACVCHQWAQARPVFCYHLNNLLASRHAMLCCARFLYFTLFLCKSLLCITFFSLPLYSYKVRDGYN